MHQFNYSTYKPNLTSFSEVLEQMEVLEKELAETDMANLIAFNHTYWIITKNIQQKLSTGYFAVEALMHQLDICFAKYYFAALKNYCNKKPTPHCWQILFDLCKENCLYQIVYMGLGVNAHVNHDLGLALFDQITSMQFESDFIKVNTVIDQSLAEVLSFLEEKPPLLNIIKNKGRSVYGSYLKRLIRNWRQNAWNNYLGLRQNTITTTDIEQTSFTIAQNLSQLRGFKNASLLGKIFL